MSCHLLCKQKWVALCVQSTPANDNTSNICHKSCIEVLLRENKISLTIKKKAPCGFFVALSTPSTWNASCQRSAFVKLSWQQNLKTFAKQQTMHALFCRRKQ